MLDSRIRTRVIVKNNKNNMIQRGSVMRLGSMKLNSDWSANLIGQNIAGLSCHYNSPAAFG